MNEIQMIELSETELSIVGGGCSGRWADYYLAQASSASSGPIASNNVVIVEDNDNNLTFNLNNVVIDGNFNVIVGSQVSL